MEWSHQDVAGESSASGLRVLALADHLGHSGGRVHGATTYYVTVYPRLARAGIDLTVCFMAPYHPAAERLEAEGISPIFLERSRWDPLALCDVLRLIDTQRIEVLHLTCFKSQILGRIAGALRGTRSIIHLHDTLPLGHANRFVQRRLARYTDLALGVSDPVANMGVEEYGLPSSKVRTLHNAIDLSAQSSVAAAGALSLREEFDLAPTSQLIGMIGRLAVMKGHEYAIRALPAIRSHCADATIIVCGEGPERSRLEDLAKDVGVEQAVVFTGQRSDIPQILGELDVVAMPSTFGEGLPYAAIEAIAAGRIVVGFPTAGIPEVVPDNVAGLMVPSGDIDALAKALTSVLVDDRLRARLEAGALHHVQNFGIDRHIETLIGHYSGR